MAGIFVKIYNTSDSVLLGYLASDAAVGFFAVPAKVVYALQQVIPAAFAAVIFPAFSYYYACDKKLLVKTFDKAFAYLTIISLPITAGLIILIPQIVTQIWPTYAAVIPTFLVMTLAIPFIFLSAVLSGIRFGGIPLLMTILLGAYFVRANYARIVGWTSPITALIGATSPLLAGFIYDTAGSYLPALVVVVAFLGVGVICALLAGPHKPVVDISQ